MTHYLYDSIISIINPAVSMSRINMIIVNKCYTIIVPRLYMVRIYYDIGVAARVEQQNQNQKSLSKTTK